MYSNQDVINAVNALTETYNLMQGGIADMLRIGSLPTPLYQNGQFFWKGLNAANMSDAPFTDLSAVGAATITAETAMRNNRYCLALGAGSVLPNIQTMPVNYWVFKVKVPEGKDGTFFINSYSTDNWGGGALAAYACDPSTQAVRRTLGVQTADKGNGYGFTPRFAPNNKLAQVARYWIWLDFNYTWEDVKDLVDDEGCLHFGLAASVALIYISGWAVAERLTNFSWLAGNNTRNGFLGGGISTNYSLNEATTGMAMFNYIANATTADVRIPYLDNGKDLLLGIYAYAPVNIDRFTYNPEIFLKGYQTQVYLDGFNYDMGNFVKLTKIREMFRGMYFKVPKEELVANTITSNGMKMLQASVEIPANEANFSFTAMWTENI